MAEDLTEVRNQANLMFADLRTKIMEAFRKEFFDRPDVQVGGQPQIVFQMAYVAALLDAAAIIGIDAGMTEEMYKKIMQESYKGAYQAAPKFG